MKLGIKIFSIVVASLFAIFLIILSVSVFVLPKIVDPIVRTVLPKVIEGKVDYSKLSVSLLRHFPRMGITLEGFRVEGVDEFEGVELCSVGNFVAECNFIHLAKKKLELLIELKDGNADIRIYKSGNANFNIFKSSTSDNLLEEQTSPPKSKKEKSKDKKENSFTGSVLIRGIKVDNLNVTYADEIRDIFAQIKGFNLFVGGNFSFLSSVLKLQADIGEASFKMGSIPLASKVSLACKTSLLADLDALRFEFQNGIISINQINCLLDGYIAFPPKDGIDMDVKASSSNISVKELLSLVPTPFVGDLKQMKSSGNVALSAFATGKLKGNSFPAFGAHLMVNQGAFKYDKLPVGVKDIKIDAKLSSSGGVLDNAYLSLPLFGFVIEDNPFTLTGDISNPISDPLCNMGANGRLDLSKLKAALPLEGINIDGVVVADFKGTGRYSAITKKNYNAIKAEGFLELYGIDFQMEGLPAVKVKSSRFDFTPSSAQLTNTHLISGDSDIALHGQVENYLGYILDNQNLSGSLKLSSKKIDLDALLDSLSSSDDKKKSTEQKVASKKAANDDGAKSNSLLVQVPSNVNANLDLDIKELTFLSIPMKEIAGKMSLKNGKAHIDNLAMDIFDGSVFATGAYGVKEKNNEADIKAQLNLKNVQLRSLFEDIKFLEKLVPFVKGLDGTITADVHLDTVVDSRFSPQLETMNGAGQITASQIDYSKINILNIINKFSDSDLLQKNSNQSTTLNFELQNGKIITKPFLVKLANSSLLFEGTSSLSQQLDYNCDIVIKEDYTLPLSITGSFKAPKVSINQQRLAKQTAELTKKKTSEAIKSAISDKYGVDLANAEAQKEALIEAAKKAGDKLISEAQAAAQKTIASAGNNPIKVALAKATAKSMVSVAQKEAQRLIQKAEKEGGALIDKVNKQYETEE